jgi:hypothetical protein
VTRHVSRTAVVVLCAWLLLPDVARADASKVVFPDTRFDFGRVPHGSLVEHDFVLRNDGSAALHILKASMTSPLVVTRMPREMAPGGEGTIHLELNTTGLRGWFTGYITVFLNDPDVPEAQLSVEGVVIPSVEVTPLQAFFVAGVRGKGASGSVEIINHEAVPLRILKVESESERFTTTVETLELGQRYKLTLMLKPDGPGGRKTEPITVATSSVAQPALVISANTYLYERVHTFPDALDLGAIPISQIRKDPGLPSRLAQTLMVYQEDGADFRAALHTDVPALNLAWTRGPKGDRYQATISFDPDKVNAGPYNGQLLIDTNDPAVPQLRVPVVGRILAQ